MFHVLYLGAHISTLRNKTKTSGALRRLAYRVIFFSENILHSLWSTEQTCDVLWYSIMYCVVDCRLGPQHKWVHSHLWLSQVCISVTSQITSRDRLIQTDSNWLWLQPWDDRALAVTVTVASCSDADTLVCRVACSDWHSCIKATVFPYSCGVLLVTRYVR